MLYWVIGIAGILGSLLRYGVEVLVSSPLGTLSVNLLGCFLLGWLAIRLSIALSIPTWLKVGSTTGLLGAFTTFSTFSIEVVKMMQYGAFLMAFLYISSSIIGGLLFAFLGHELGIRQVRHQKEKAV